MNGYGDVSPQVILDRRDLLRFPNGPLAPAAPIVPTAVDSWGTAPTNLANCTDGNPDTATGVGDKTASGTIGTLMFDLGSVHEFLVTAKVGIGTNTGNIYPSVGYSLDGSTTVINYLAQSTSSAYESVRYIGPYYLRSRYFGVRIATSTSATGQARFYDVKAIQI